MEQRTALSMTTELETFLAAPSPELRQEAFAALVRTLKAALKSHGFDAEAASVLRRAAIPSLDFTSAQALYRLLQQVRTAPDDAKTAVAGKGAGTPCRLAVISSFTAGPLTQLIDLFLYAAGVDAEIYEAEYGTFRQEIIDPQSGLYEFKPQIVFIATSWRDLSHIPKVTQDRAAAQAAVEAEVAEWKNLWQTLSGRASCQIIQNNFDAPPWRALDNFETRHPAGRQRFIAAVNAGLADAAPAHVTLHDLDHLAASLGRWKFSDERFFHMAKLPCAPECTVPYAHAVASLAGAHLGLAKKCLVLDLDNTLWGGVIGDDGLGGIRLGQGSAEGEAFLAIQRYARDLMARGVILAVCSKNEEKNAREAFDKHPEMVLRYADISCFMANWNDKAANLRAIAKQLNIGLNALVFMDDNSAERSVVRQLVPEVAVPELPADPADYVQALEQYHYFQVVSLGAEDLKRTTFYAANAQREALQSAAGDIDAFLASLNMTARVEAINAVSLERAAQLINKSNQFNLTTRRYAAAQVAAISNDPAWATRTVTLADRFGDNGLISVLLAKVQDDALAVDTWLMSCRVLRRGVEDLLLDHAVRIARARGLKKIIGEYIRTPKNDLVADHYAKLGFTPLPGAPDGHTRWTLAVADFRPRPTFIKELADHG